MKQLLNTLTPWQLGKHGVELRALLLKDYEMMELPIFFWVAPLVGKLLPKTKRNSDFKELPKEYKLPQEKREQNISLFSQLVKYFCERLIDYRNNQMQHSRGKNSVCVYIYLYIDGRIQNIQLYGYSCLVFSFFGEYSCKSLRNSRAGLHQLVNFAGKAYKKCDSHISQAGLCVAVCFPLCFPGVNLPANPQNVTAMEEDLQLLHTGVPALRLILCLLRISSVVLHSLHLTLFMHLTIVKAFRSHSWVPQVFQCDRDFLPSAIVYHYVISSPLAFWFSE